MKKQCLDIKTKLIFFFKIRNCLMRAYIYSNNS